MDYQAIREALSPLLKGTPAQRTAILKKAAELYEAATGDFLRVEDQTSPADKAAGQMVLRVVLRAK